MKFVSIVLFYVVSTLASSVVAQCIDDKSTKTIVKNVNSLLDEILTNNDAIPGISLNIQFANKCNNLNFVKGVIDLGSSQKLTADHAFRIASNTKTYTAAAVLKLSEIGLLDIDMPIGHYLPKNLMKIVNQYNTLLTDRTVRSILNHTSGLPEHTRDKRYFESIFKNPNYQWTAQEQVSLLATYKLPLANANSAFSYSDTGYILLGEAIQHITQKSLAASFHSLLNFKDLNINQTWHETFEIQPKDVAGRVHQYYDKKDTFAWHPSLDLYGGGGLVATSEDLSDFLRHLMNGDVFANAKTLELMKEIPIVSENVQYSMGLFKKTFSGVAFWGHTGFWNTFSFYSPEKQITLSGSILQKKAIKGTELANNVYKIIQDNLKKNAIAN